MTAPSMDESLVVFSRIPQVRPPGGCRGEGRGVGGSPSPPGWGWLREMVHKLKQSKLKKKLFVDMRH